MLLEHLHGQVCPPSPDPNDHTLDPASARPPTFAISMASIVSSSRLTRRLRTPDVVAFVPYNSRCTATTEADDCRRFPISKEETTGQPSHHRSACPRRREFAAMRQQQGHTSQMLHRTISLENQLALDQGDRVYRACKALALMRGDSPAPQSALRQHQFCRHGMRSPRPAWSQLSVELAC